MLHAVYRVGDMATTIDYYKKHFGMKLLRYRDIPDVSASLPVIADIKPPACHSVFTALMPRHRLRTLLEAEPLEASLPLRASCQVEEAGSRKELDLCTCRCDWDVLNSVGLPDLR